MTPLHLDYQRERRPVPWLGIAVLAAAAAAAAAVGGVYDGEMQRLERWDSQAERLARATSRPVARPRAATEQAMRMQVLEVKQANEVVRELGVPWNALFAAVDASADEGVALLALEPDTQKGTVRITGEAKDLDVLLAYVKQLGTHDVFAGVLLQNHQVQVEVPEKPLRFSVVARWKGVTS